MFRAPGIGPEDCRQNINRSDVVLPPVTSIGAVRRKLRTEGVCGLAEAVWRNGLRRTPLGTGVSAVFDDVLLEKLVMAPRVGYWPQIRQPNSFNEKIMHRKIFTEKELFTKVSDKVTARTFVESKVGDDILNEVYHIAESPEEIPFESLPTEFVIKTGNKHVIIVDDKSKINETSIERKCSDALAEPYGSKKGEYWYRDAHPKLLIERRLHGDESDIPRDFKFFVFRGEVEYIQVDIDRYTNHTRRFYDKNWNPQEFELEFPLGSETPEPDRLDEMIDIAETLGEEFAFIRVDLYHTANSGVVFGELTVAPGSGGERFRPKRYDFELGLLW